MHRAAIRQQPLGDVASDAAVCTRDEDAHHEAALSEPLQITPTGTHVRWTSTGTGGTKRRFIPAPAGNTR